MKTKKIFLIMAGLTFTIACYAQHEHSSTTDPLRNKTRQDSVMETICNDHQLMNNMMKHIMQNEHAMKMMAQNKEMMKLMMDMGSKDSSMCISMMGMMTGNKAMHQMMMNMKQQSDMPDAKMKQDSASSNDHSHH